MASTVTTAPSMASSSSRAGMATISLDLSPPTLGLPEHHALARGEGRDDMNGLFAPLLLVGAPHRFAIDGDHLGRRLRQPRRPRHKTALERDRVELGEDDAQLIVRGRAVGEGSKRRRNSSLARPKRAMSATVSTPASAAASITSSTSSSG